MYIHVNNYCVIIVYDLKIAFCFHNASPKFFLTVLTMFKIKSCFAL